MAQYIREINGGHLILDSFFSDSVVCPVMKYEMTKNIKDENDSIKDGSWQ
jgi:hypothetical protein